MSIEPHTHIAEDILINIKGHTTIKGVIEELVSEEPIVNLYSSINLAENGQSIDTLSLTWNLTKGNVSYFFLSEVGELDPKIRGYTFVNQNITTNKTYTLNYGNQFFQKSISTNLVFSNKIYWGLSKNKNLSNQEILSLNSEIKRDKFQTRIFYPNNEYIYFAIPESYDKPTFKFNGILSSAWEASSYFFVNSYGYSESYAVYRSTFLQNGHGIIVEIF
jgi:hypothetical protein